MQKLLTTAPPCTFSLYIVAYIITSTWHAEDNKNVTHTINCAKNNVLLLVKLFLKKALYNTMPQIACQQGTNS